MVDPFSNNAREGEDRALYWLRVISKVPYSDGSFEADVRAAIETEGGEVRVSDGFLVVQDGAERFRFKREGATYVPDPLPSDAYNRLKPVIGRDNLDPYLDEAWSIDDVLPLSGIAAVYGSPGSGKSVIVTDMMLHVASGKPWREKPVQRGIVIYAALEGGKKFRNRIVAAAKHNEFGVDDLALFVSLNVGIDLRSSGSDRKSMIDLALDLTRELGFPLRAIVIDTLNRAFGGGNENEPGDMGQLVSSLDEIINETDCLVVLVHHSGKDADRGMRGHSSLLGAVDTELKCSKAEGGRRIEATKQRDGETGIEFAFDVSAIEVGTSRSGKNISAPFARHLEIHEVTPKKETKGLGKNQVIVMDSLQILAAEPSQDTNPSGPGWPEEGSFTVIDANELLNLAKGKLPPPEDGKDDRRRDSVVRALKDLIAQGKLCQNQGMVWNPNRKRKK
ncbi:AAA family ATPase [Ruegeria atlantica]|uniref:AAA+ ATPase domain-containing protein n=1 Tax=Ruegeria atlantica TaxID=81569 RepID=A0A0P1EC16_9RHOB|nr:AAA family ATPase [Ruegeria atlantica]CUH46448.1 hypothetical protein RUA4292_00614 [Ruegeria atlantica]